MISCIVCGCTQNSACFHHRSGPCSWADYDLPLCSHCCIPNIFNDCERPVTNLRNVKKLAIGDLMNIFYAIDIKVAAEPAVKNTASIYKIRFESVPADLPDFELLLKCWFPDTVNHGDNTWIINLSQHVMLQHKKAFAAEKRKRKGKEL